MHRFLLVVGIAVFLTGCANSDPALDSAAIIRNSVRAANASYNQNAADNNTCVSYGAKPGTDLYTECRLKLAQMHQDQDLAVAQQNQEAQQAEQSRRLAIVQAIVANQRASIPPVPYNPIPPIPLTPQLNCSTMTAGNQTYTHCQ